MLSLVFIIRKHMLKDTINYYESYSVKKIIK